MTKPSSSSAKVFDVVSRGRDGELLGLAVGRGGVPADPEHAKRGDYIEIVLPRGKSAVGVGERVLARLVSNSKARVMKRLERRSSRRFFGVLALDESATKNESGDNSKNGLLYRVDPIDRSIRPLLLGSTMIGSALVGDLVEITSDSGVNRVERTFGCVDSPGSYWVISATEHDLPRTFDDSVLSEVLGCSSLDPTASEDRADWRDLPFVTIDPSDARDHDDAVMAESDSDSSNVGGCIVRVAISDVSFFVCPGSLVDKEALNRGNSVYFPNTVIPMLPELLSTDLCSLHENVDRPALSVLMRFDSSGRKIDHKFVRSLIRSRASLTYEEAESRPAVTKSLWEAYEVVRRGRLARSPLELDIPEQKIRMKDNKILGVDIPVRLESHRLIEEFMIQANVCAAETLERTGSPLIYRVHDSPSSKKVEGLRSVLKGLGLPVIKLGGLRAHHLNGVLERSGDYSEFLGELILRAQSQAEYNTLNIGHFGLNLPRYAHFTSPIRRYADLTVHRCLIRHLTGSSASKEDNIDLSSVSERLSFLERRAMRAERQTVDRLVASYMSEQIGAEFSGRISGVTRYGLFVGLTDTGADGFVSLSSLGGGRFDIKTHTLNTDMGLYRLGDSVDVRLTESFPVSGGLKFELLSKGRPVRRTPKKGGKPKKKTTRSASGRGRGRSNNRGRSGGGKKRV